MISVRTDMKSSALSWRAESWHCRSRSSNYRGQQRKMIETTRSDKKLLSKCNLGFFCECIWVKPSCKRVIRMGEALLRFTVFSFSGQTHFQWECFYDSIKISIFKTLRRLDTTWNFARSITRVSTYEHEHWEHCLCTQSLLKRRFLGNSR